jgi:hypothetical protein
MAHLNTVRDPARFNVLGGLTTQATVQRDTGVPVPITIGPTGAIGSRPSGQWTYLVVFVTFPDKDANYAWRLR